ncbi:ADA regulatory protein / Methylated-DNA--protein-cysteine methyltransferase, partial [Pseudomonas savastanoi pv. nerii]
MTMENMKGTLKTRAPRTEEDPRWEVLLNRRSGAGADFVYGVLTTGIYCKPGSPS